MKALIYRLEGTVILHRPASVTWAGKDPAAIGFTASTDTNGILWENFNAWHQAEEIIAEWPDTT